MSRQTIENTCSYDSIFLKRIFIPLNVYHSSALQTISVKSVFTKVIDYNASIWANLNNIKKLKQKKKHTHFNLSVQCKNYLV